MVRAARLDATLYRDIASPDAGNRQAVVLILITAVIWGVHAVVLKSASVLRQTTGAASNLDSGLLATLFAVPAIAQVASWLIWAAGLWIIGSRWISRDREAPWFGQVARALAFAQAPVVLAAVISVPAAIFVGALYALPILPDGVREDLPVVATSGFSGLVTAWVLVGMFLATREALGLSNPRTLASLMLINLALAVLLGVLVVVLSGIAGRDAVGLMEDWVGFRDDRPSAVDVAYRLDFNFGFLGLSDNFLYYLSRSILHPFAGVSGG